MVFGSTAFKAVVSNGLVLDKNGEKMSKHVVDIGTVQVDAVVVFRGIVAWHEAFVAQGIGGHHSGGHSLVDFIEESLHGIGRARPAYRTERHHKVETGLDRHRTLWKVA